MRSYTTKKTSGCALEGNARLTEPNGRITYGQIIDLTDDYRDGFVDSLRLEAPDDTRYAAARADRSQGNYTVLQNGVYTACEPCKDNPNKPPEWQVKAARIIHDDDEKMIYFENATIDFFGLPVAYFPFLSAPDTTVKRKSGFLYPTLSTSNAYGVSIETPYYFNLAPDYDLTLYPTFHVETRPDVGGRMESKAAERCIQHQSRGNLSTGSRILCLRIRGWHRPRRRTSAAPF